MTSRPSLGHIGIAVSDPARSFPFWKDLLAFLDMSIVTDDGDHFDASDGRAYLCFTRTWPEQLAAGYHRRRTGLTHLAFNVESREQVDRFAREFLATRDIEPLYGGAREYPDYTDDYYAVFFEDPDRIKIEIAYDPHSARATPAPQD